MRKVAVVGLYAIKNAGDNILCEATQYLIKQVRPGTRIVEVDVNPRANSYKGWEIIPFTISKVLIKISSYLFKYEHSSRFRYFYEYFMWWLKINHKFRSAFKDVDAIVFAGGGFLKFKTQGLNYYVEQIVKIAQKRQIPIMMNGVGIEGYDEKDIRCQNLKRMINSDCVKIITTRDDIDTLQNKYITNSAVRTARVGDPALWTPECYGLKREGHNDMIGINIIRGRVFQAYGNSLSEFQLMNFYKKLILGIENRGYQWVLFSNGMRADQVFGIQLLKMLQYKQQEKLLPAPDDSMEFLEMIKEFKCVFGARLHACITAYSLDVPVVGLIWSEKLQIFSEVIHKPQNFFSEDKMNVEAILDRMEKSFEDKYDKGLRMNAKNLTRSYVEEFMNRI